MPIKVVGQTSDRHPRRPWNSPENRRKRQGEYMEKHGPQKPRRKRLWPATEKRPEKKKSTRGKGTKDLRDRLKEITSRTRPSINERLGGGVKAKPHSTKEGRTAAGKRRIKRLFSKEATRPRPGRPGTPGRPLPRPRPLPSPGGPSPSTPKWRHEERIMTPLRAKHAVGSLVKKVISKIKPTPKPKPKGKGKGLGSGVKPSEMHEIIPKKDRKLYLKEKLANPHLMKLRNKESKKVFKSAKGKAEGGRIGLRHGGSVGAAVRGHGAEIK